MLPDHAAGICLDALLVRGKGRGEGMVQERPSSRVLVTFEEREVGHPVESVRPPFGELELATQMNAQAAEHATDRMLVGGSEEHGRAGLGTERSELLLREELRDRRANLAVVVDEVCEPLCSPLLRDLFETGELGPREHSRHDEIADDRSVRKDTELRGPRRLGRIFDLEPVA